VTQKGENTTAVGRTINAPSFLMNGQGLPGSEILRLSGDHGDNFGGIARELRLKLGESPMFLLVPK